MSNNKTIQDILGWFCNVRRAKAGQWRADCPICDTKGHRHLYITEGNNNSALIHCMHECAPQDILASVGKTLADLYFDAPSKERAAARTARKEAELTAGLASTRTVNPVASTRRDRIHVYTDADGNQTHRKSIRFDSDGHKRAFWEHLEAGAWVTGGADTPLYNLAGLASADAKTIFITEGEKDADTLRDVFGLVATTAGGATNWKDRHTEQLRQYVKDKTVVILTDNDSDGEKMGKTVLEAVRPICKEAYILPTSKYWSNAPEHGDITDYVEACTAAESAFDAMGVKEQLAHIVKAMQAESSLPTREKKFTFKKVSEYTGEAHRYLWYPYLPMHQYSVLLASSGTGKSILTCGVAAALTTGTPLPSMDPDQQITPEPCDVVIIASEDSGAEYRSRLEASGADVDRVHILDRDDSIGLTLADDAPDIIEAAKATGAKLLIVDPWQAFCGESIDLNRMNQVRPFLQKVAHLAKDADVAIILVSHVNKRAQDMDANNAACGSSELINASRSAFKLINAGDNNRIMVHTKSSYDASGKSVCFQIVEDGGLRWTGFSDVTKATLEEAARSKKTVAEIHQQQAYLEAKKEEAFEASLRDAERINQLCDAIEAIVDSSEHKTNSIGIAYREISDKRGESIFGGILANQALRAAADELKRRGYSISFKSASGAARRVWYTDPTTGIPKQAKGFLLIRDQTPNDEEG